MIALHTAPIYSVFVIGFPRAFRISARLIPDSTRPAAVPQGLE